jgi:hypothetical protein
MEGVLLAAAVVALVEVFEVGPGMMDLSFEPLSGDKSECLC